MIDSRLQQWSEMLDDIRTESADMLDEGIGGERRIVLTSLRRNANAALADIKRLEQL